MAKTEDNKGLIFSEYMFYLGAKYKVIKINDEFWLAYANDNKPRMRITSSGWIDWYSKYWNDNG